MGDYPPRLVNCRNIAITLIWPCAGHLSVMVCYRQLSSTILGRLQTAGSSRTLPHRAMESFTLYDGRFLAGDRAFEQDILATPAEAIGVVFSISPHAEREGLPLDLRGLHKHMVVFPQLRTKVDRHKIGEQRLVDHDWVARIVGSKDQGAGSAFAEILRHNEEVVFRPRHRCYADVVAQFAGTSAGCIFKK